MFINSSSNNFIHLREFSYQIVLNSPHPIRSISTRNSNSENLQQILPLRISKAIILNNLDGINTNEKYTKAKHTEEEKFTARRESIHINQLAPSSDVASMSVIVK